MYRLIESIRLLDGKFCNISYHEQRMSRSLCNLYGGNHKIGLERYLSKSAYPAKGLFKCRIVYSNVSREVHFIPYMPRTIERVKLVEDNAISYAFKFEDRKAIDRLFALRGDCDDVLIIKDGMVTDCSFSNIVFRSGKEWFTPATPLLEGTMRQQLIDGNIIAPREIRKTDIRSFDTFRIINALLQFDSPEIEVSAIVF